MDNYYSASRQQPEERVWAKCSLYEVTTSDILTWAPGLPFGFTSDDRVVNFETNAHSDLVILGGTAQQRTSVQDLFSAVACARGSDVYTFRGKGRVDGRYGYWADNVDSAEVDIQGLSVRARGREQSLSNHGVSDFNTLRMELRPKNILVVEDQIRRMRERPDLAKEWVIKNTFEDEHGIEYEPSLGDRTERISLGLRCLPRGARITKITTAAGKWMSMFGESALVFDDRGYGYASLIDHLSRDDFLPSGCLDDLRSIVSRHREDLTHVQVWESPDES